MPFKFSKIELSYPMLLAGSNLLLLILVYLFTIVFSSSNKANVNELLYKSTLNKLFHAVQRPSRHSNAPKTSEIFQSRKEFFQKLSKKYIGSNKTPIYVHVAGTKGKGSTVAYIAAALNAAGKKVGVFTSPHLHTACERIKIGNQIIDKSDVIRLGTWVIQEMKDESWCVFFDLFLAIALRYFHENEVEYILLETGIGGRYDSTNFLDEVGLAVITSISIDHQAVLGNTIEEIAKQKAGIVKQNCKLVTTSKQVESVTRVLQKECEDKNAECLTAQPDADMLHDAGIPATHDVEIENACLAYTALKELDISPTGMKDAFWPCRMEKFRINDIDIILDGCHNEDSVTHFIRSVKQMYKISSTDNNGSNGNMFNRMLSFKWNSREKSTENNKSKEENTELITLFGGGQDKSLSPMLEVVARESHQLVLTQSSHFRAADEKMLQQSLPVAYKHKIQSYRSEGNESGDYNNDSNSNSNSKGNSKGKDEIKKIPQPEDSKGKGNVADSLRQCIAELSTWSTIEVSEAGGNNDADADAEYSGKGNGKDKSRRVARKVVVVCGSLFGAAEAREALYAMKPDLFDKDDWVRMKDDV